MDELNEFLLCLYRASHDVPLDEFQAHAVTLLQALVPFDLARWGTTVRDERGAAYQTPWFYKDPPESLQDYNEFREQDTAAVLVMANPDKALNFPLADFYPDSSTGIRAYQRRYEHAHALIASHRNTETGLFDALSVYGTSPAHPFTEAHRQLAELAFPHLREALRINHSVHVERLRHSGADLWAVAICDAAGRLRYAEPQFTDLLRTEWPNCPREHLPDELIRVVSVTKVSRHVGRAVVFCIDVLHGVASIRARPRMLVDELSRRELEVARQVATGRTYKEIARILKISPATVRHHIQTIHEHMGVRNNVELAVLLGKDGF
ncbi:helix-turn-helix transcriptional regulator [Paraburkholderia flagellata]|uniref:helix-turn-helix transcriptional regulator n=1 Tax=Paraburkholderia flagellata TaxID=2883241 RepID=UPI0027E4E90A|nr:helix-turn-helix transcriptional regulator [Paraburkholderia flagellata]